MKKIIWVEFEGKKIVATTKREGADQAKYVLAAAPKKAKPKPAKPKPAKKPKAKRGRPRKDATPVFEVTAEERKMIEAAREANAAVIAAPAQAAE